MVTLNGDPRCRIPADFQFQAYFDRGRLAPLLKQFGVQFDAASELLTFHKNCDASQANYSISRGLEAVAVEGKRDLSRSHFPVKALDERLMLRCFLNLQLLLPMSVINRVNSRPRE